MVLVLLNILSLFYLILNIFEFSSENIYLIILYFFIILIINSHFFIVKNLLSYIHLKEIQIIEKKAYMTIRLFWFYIILFYLRFVMYKSLVAYIYLLNRTSFNKSTIFVKLLINYIKYKLNLDYSIDNLNLNNLLSKAYKKIKQEVHLFLLKKNNDTILVYFI